MNANYMFPHNNRVCAGENQAFDGLWGPMIPVNTARETPWHVLAAFYVILPYPPSVVGHPAKQQSVQGLHIFLLPGGWRHETKYVQ